MAYEKEHWTYEGTSHVTKLVSLVTLLLCVQVFIIDGGHVTRSGLWLETSVLTVD